MFQQPFEYALQSCHNCRKLIGAVHVSYSINSHDDDFSSGTCLDYCFDQYTFKRLAFDTVLGLQRFVIALSLDDFAAQNNMLQIKDRQLIVVHLLAACWVMMY